MVEKEERKIKKERRNLSCQMAAKGKQGNKEEKRGGSANGGRREELRWPIRKERKEKKEGRKTRGIEEGDPRNPCDPQAKRRFLAIFHSIFRRTGPRNRSQSSPWPSLFQFHPKFEGI